jgi:hypothetical protein
MRALLRGMSGPARCPAARDIFIDRLANARFELGQIPWQIDHNVALLPIHGIKLDAEFCPAVIGLTAAVARHASHKSLLLPRCRGHRFCFGHNILANMKKVIAE